ncbi:MAG TPA: ABC transporter permease [Vicinamibacteria bacterium]|nr:ABC transporter permease [Vicinamibacteria bacterium]
MTRPPLTLRLCRRLLAVASWILPRAQRAEWRQEWEAEVLHRWLNGAGLQAATRLGLLRRVMGALPDAAWMRRQLTADADAVRDLRHALRLLHRRRGFALAVVAVLALGVGATTALFALIDALLLRPLPYAESERLMTLWESNPRAGEEPDDVAPGDFFDWQQRSTRFQGMAAAVPFAYDYTGGSAPEVFFAVRVTEGFFRTMGVVPLLGRDFLPEEHVAGRENVVLLDHAFWKRRFGGDPRIVGTLLPLEGLPYTVVGVLPPGFEPGLLPTAGPRGIWTPHVVAEHERRTRGSAWWAAVARLKPGVTREAAQSEMDAIAAVLAGEHPRTNQGVKVLVIPFAEHLTGSVRAPLRLLAGAAALVLLLAAANVVGLLLARGAERERELAVRAALGAGRLRLVRQLLAETLLLGALACAAGVLLARWAIASLVALTPVDVPRLGTVALDARALAFAGAVALLTTVACGLAAALVASRPAARGTLRDPGRALGVGRQPLRRTLVVAQVAAALMLLFGAGLLGRSFARLLRTDPGFTADGALALQVFVWDRNATPPRQVAFFRETLARIESLPGVTAAGIVSRMPFIEANIGIRSPLTVEGRPAAAAGEDPSVYLTIASRRYFEAMAIRLRAGRLFEDADRLEGAPVALVNESLARRLWRGANPIGSRLGLRWRGRPLTAEVVGVVASALHRRLDREPDPEVFLSSEQVPYGSMTYVVRVASGASSMIIPVQRAIWSVDPQQSFYRTATVEELVARSLAPRRFLLLVLAAFAAIALALAATGLYGLISFLATRRTQEIGLRVALGARGRDIVRLVVGEGMALVAAGAALGAAGSLVGGRLLRGVLAGLSPADPATGLAVLAVLMLVAVSACLLPALRALRVDPAVALRGESAGYGP